MIFRGYTLIGHTARKLAKGFLPLLMLIVAAQMANAADAVKGKALFDANCARCHSAKLEKASTGPALYQVSERIPAGDWKYRWVKNSSKLIQEGDPYAVKIWNENNKASMDPMPQLENGDIDDIFAFIDTYTIPIASVAADGGNGPTEQEQAALDSLWNWILLLLFVVVVLLGGIAMQIARLRGVEFMAGVNWDKLNARLFLAFFVLGMIATFWAVRYYQPYYIQDNPASEHGKEIDRMFWITMGVVFSVFVITNGLLFFFAYRYGKDGGRKAKYYPENHKLEMLWTIVPAIVLTVLVIFGVRAWTSVMSKPEVGPNYTQIEVSGQQWGWILRYPGDDKTLGTVDVRLIGGDNILGVDMREKASADDFISNDLVLMKGQLVDLKIRSRDVLHSVYLPHFRVKMDAVPGMDTRFHFVPIKTTADFRKDLMGNKYWSQVDTIVTKTIQPDSTAGPDAKPITVTDTVYKADLFDFELACTEVCGRGHFSMRKKVVVLEKDEWIAWYNEQKKKNLASEIKSDPMAGRPYLGSNQQKGKILE